MFSGSESFKYGQFCQESGPSADIHELRFKAAKCSDMDCVELQGGLFVVVKNGI